MKYKARIILIITACVVLIFIGQLTFAKIFFNKGKSSGVKDILAQNTAIPTGTTSQEPTPQDINLHTPLKNGLIEENELNVSKFNEGMLNKIPAEDLNKYEFTTIATGNDITLFAGSDKNDKTKGIIYCLRPHPNDLNRERQEYSFEGKGSITFVASEEKGNFLTFNCAGGKGYFEVKDRIVVFENYYLKKLKENPYFDPDTYEFEDLNETKVKMSKDDAVERAVRQTPVEDIINKSKKTSAVLVMYTNKKYPQVPGMSITLEDCPVWIVTFSGLEKMSSGGKAINGTEETNESKYMDTHVFIGANSGIWLGSVSHTSLLPDLENNKP